MSNDDMQAKASINTGGNTPPTPYDPADEIIARFKEVTADWNNVEVSFIAILAFVLGALIF